ncbi:ribosomal RNA processing protein 1 homolog B [Rhinoraja longicauda]
MAAAEIQFAQRLASNEKRFRDRAVKKLRRYLSARSQRLSGGFSQDELLKIWKGIFYCMWMQDKPLLQEELAESIAQLVHTFRNLDAKFLFLETFFQTMNREWNGIDRLRMDKFYTLIRLVLRQFLQELKSTGWDESVVGRFLRCVTDEVLNTARNAAPSGVRYHFIDIYLQELAKVGTEQLTAEQNLKFIEPFCRIAAKTKDRTLFHMITQGIFEMMVDQAPFAIEDLMDELQASEDEDTWAEELRSSPESVKPPKPLPKINGSASGEDAGLVKLGGAAEGPKQSHNINDVGPVLQFDYGAVADHLFQLSSRAGTPTHNRKCLYKLVRKFRDLAEGIFPQDAIPCNSSSDEEDEDDFNWRKKKRKQRLQRAVLGKDEGVDKKKPGKGKNKKKRCPKGRLPSGAGENEGSTEGADKEVSETKAGSLRELLKKKKRRLIVVDGSLTPESAVGGSDEPRTESQRQENVEKEQVIKSEADLPPLPGTADSVTLVSKRKRKRKKKVLPQVPLSNGTSWPEGSTPKEPVVCKKVKRDVVKLQKQSKKAAGGSEVPASQPGVRSKRKAAEQCVELGKKLKLRSSPGVTVDDARPNVPIPAPSATEPCAFVKFESIPVPKPLFFRRVGGVKSTPRRRRKEIKTMSTSHAKKVRFGLRKNTTAEFKRTDKSILVSPAGTSRVAFDPKQQPRHSVLKANSSPGSPSVLRHKRVSFTTSKWPLAMGL